MPAHSDVCVGGHVFGHCIDSVIVGFSQRAVHLITGQRLLKRPDCLKPQTMILRLETMCLEGGFSISIQLLGGGGHEAKIRKKQQEKEEMRNKQLGISLWSVRPKNSWLSLPLPGRQSSQSAVLITGENKIRAGFRFEGQSWWTLL